MNFCSVPSTIQGGPKVGVLYTIYYILYTFGPPCITSLASFVLPAILHLHFKILSLNIMSRGISAIIGAAEWIKNYMYIMHYGHPWRVMFSFLYYEIWRDKAVSLLYGIIAFICKCLSEAQRSYISQPIHIYTILQRAHFNCCTVWLLVCQHVGW